jgi:hypothetical protein
MGTLYYGDNLDILRRYLKEETADLVYLHRSRFATTVVRFALDTERGWWH